MTDADSKTPGSPSPSDADLMREQRIQRNLKILVIGMGVLILAGLGAVAVRVLQFSKPTETRLTASAGSAVAAAGEIGMELPKGARVVSVSLSGDRLAVHHESPAGTGITIIDLATGRRIADVKPLEAVPRN